ncbi:hypothetical protein [Sulfuriferula nivalis]|uniref:Uncharacterized protein n=1 Tax=Sulfuriferula nivalis TaxID=2675298 RepID=A0A809SGT8_9PROT|nr:hypothetical protein [Sulfuriferula nivalis]BBP00210.1 hypothetical protein SFSGTM_09180 [Sulfuriferula nivalis]
MKLYSSSQTVLQATFSSLAASQLQKTSAASLAPSTANTSVATTYAGADISSSSVTLAAAIASTTAYQAKQLDAMKSAIATMRAMPASAKDLSKRMATEKAAMLKQILNMLKQMAIGATPAQAKALAAQLKDIAKQLAALGKLLAENGGAANTDSTTASVTASNTDISTSAVATASTTTDTATSSNASTTTTTDASVTATTGMATGTPSASTASPRNTSHALAAYAAEFSRINHTGSQTGNATDKELKAALQDALKSLRAVLALLKNKLGSHNKDIKDTENKMLELARSLSESGNPIEQIAATVASVQDNAAANDADTASTTIPAVDTSAPTDISISVST